LSAHAQAFERYANESGRACELFLPWPDRSPTGKPYWMLPNQLAFANLYGRLNLLHDHRLRGITMVHDEQNEFGAVLRQGKASLEQFADVGRKLQLPHSDFGFEESATLEFGRSQDHLGIQVADVLAGFVMRFMRAGLSGGADLKPVHMEIMHDLMGISDPERSLGMNFVASDPLLKSLGIFV